MTWSALALPGWRLGQITERGGWPRGATTADLGRSWKDLPAGVGYGAAACGVVLLVLIVAAVIPVTNGFLDETGAIADSSAGEPEKRESAPGTPARLAAQSPGPG
jgi:hypothetical protein